MTLDSIFQAKRFAQVLRRDLQLEWKTLLIGAVAMIGFLKIVLLIGYTDGGSNSSAWFHSFGFPFALFVGGYLFTASIFNEMDTQTGRHFYLLIPASQGEKFLSKFLLTTVVYIGLTILLYQIFAWLASWFLLSQFNIALPAFQPFSHQNLEFLAFYFVTQSVFFLGAVQFRRFAFGKTVATLAVIGVVLALFLILVFRLVFHDQFQGSTMDTGQFGVGINIQLESFLKKYSHTLENLFWYLTAPIMWLVAFLKLKETEA